MGMIVMAGAPTATSIDGFLTQFVQLLLETALELAGGRDQRLQDDFLVGTLLQGKGGFHHRLHELLTKCVVHALPSKRSLLALGRVFFTSTTSASKEPRTK